MSRTYWIAAEDMDSARRRAYAVEAGRLPYLAHYASEEAATAWADQINAILAVRTARVFAIVIEHVTTHDGRIPVARVVNRVGEIAAGLVITIGGAWLVGWSSLL